ncbi:MAG: hypothetical protein COT81_03870 [Candidatus Buchananbacteria bacterium CG10_big_fil_rev_8_21_14_0_10_42_9]|uniref:AAA+ ATPase domain-containing protein n=1 Tax=Candidatus Buchananbacteria bacterium CG10_big_fil_rev_8_21_14_0_10_42_9 TaxID=1974526 RepID=A0A2H0W0P0_9BACT|nr:MAG: hypothetical protein COT81_03870 [Candidatus Buchananbacteria bacterium CG10_big_fil_rev_8_21_14_0_10_42_9]
MVLKKFNNLYYKLWKELENEGLLTKDEFKGVLKQARNERKYVTHLLLENVNYPDDVLLKVYERVFEAPKVNLHKRQISPQILNLIPKEVAEMYSVVLFKKDRNIINVATTAPENQQTIDFIKKKTGLEPFVFVTTPKDIQIALRRYKNKLADEFEQIIKSSMKEAMDVDDTEENMANFVPVIKMVDSILDRGLLNKASDVHIEPNGRKVTVRFRVDGMLQKVVELPKQLHPAILARIKLIAKLKIDEHKKPQDGRFNYRYEDRDVAMRVSVMPTMYGSKIVLRILDTTEKDFSLTKLGLNKRDYTFIKSEANKTQGMLLVTGPTGSGKTTTLYTILRLLNKEDVNICTIEDPIEYGLDGINQSQINPNGGVTFASGLRSLLRQDPNILMVGEIRDQETGEISVNSAMTGHLVLSTLHTNSAFLAPQRLIEMGVQPYLVASVVDTIIGQRLVRKICSSCRSYVRTDSKAFERYQRYFDLQKIFLKLQKLGYINADEKFENIKFGKGRGCNKCNKSGYRGRIGIYEMLRNDDHIHKMILANASADDIRSYAVEQGALTMQEDGLLKVFEGKTTLDEVIRVTYQ